MHLTERNKFSNLKLIKCYFSDFARCAEETRRKKHEIETEKGRMQAVFLGQNDRDLSTDNGR